MKPAPDLEAVVNEESPARRVIGWKCEAQQPALAFRFQPSIGPRDYVEKYLLLSLRLSGSGYHLDSPGFFQHEDPALVPGTTDDAQRLIKPESAERIFESVGTRKFLPLNSVLSLAVT